MIKKCQKITRIYSREDCQFRVYYSDFELKIWLKNEDFWWGTLLNSKWLNLAQNEDFSEGNPYPKWQNLAQNEDFW